MIWLSNDCKRAILLVLANHNRRCDPEPESNYRNICLRFRRILTRFFDRFRLDVIILLEKLLQVSVFSEIAALYYRDT